MSVRGPGTSGGGTVWLTGLPSAGKSTIAAAVERALRRRGVRTQVLDGDVVRGELCADLGFSRADRDTNVRRIGWAARLLASHGVVVLVPVIAPYARSRRMVRSGHEEHGLPFLEVHVDTPLETCAQRDVKGLFARQRAGSLHGLTGVDDPYESPSAPELRLRTVGRSPEDCASDVLRRLVELGLVTGGSVGVEHDHGAPRERSGAASGAPPTDTSTVAACIPVPQGRE